MAVGQAAAREAVAQAVSALGNDPSLVLLFPDGSLDAGLALEQARNVVPGVEVAGMTASGEIGPGGPIDGGCSAMAFGPAVAAGRRASPRVRRPTRGRPAQAPRPWRSGESTCRPAIRC